MEGEAAENELQAMREAHTELKAKLSRRDECFDMAPCHLVCLLRSVYILCMGLLSAC